MKRILTVVLVLAAAVGCKRKPEPEPAKPVRNGVASVEERMADKEYVKQLDAQCDERDKLSVQAAAAKTDEEKKAAAAALEANRQKTMGLIRKRMKK